MFDVKTTAETSANINLPAAGINMTADENQKNTEASADTTNGSEQQTSSETSADKTTAELFLENFFRFRRNTLGGIVEYRRLSDENWRPLTEEAINSIILLSKHELGEDADLKADIKTYVNSEEPELYDPIIDYFESLPAWDGKDRVVSYWTRISGISAYQVYLLSIWLRSVVAHWIGMDAEHGNECVPVLIGDQGIGKTTFWVKFLPENLRCYFLDHFNLGNKFDKDMALSSTLLVSLDEVDKYTARQMAEIKQSLSRSTVTARKIYGRTIEVRHRKSSFVATTNCRQPLTDPTGSRRFLCIEVAKGERIDFETKIEYAQLHAQILYELREQKARYWFNEEETRNIQDANLPYQKELNLQDMITYVFRKPLGDETGETFTSAQIQQHLLSSFPRVKTSQISCIKIGKVMKTLEVDRHRDKHNTYYSLIKTVG